MKFINEINAKYLKSEYKECKTIEQATMFGEMYFSNWLKDFQTNSKDLNFRDRKFTENDYNEVKFLYGENEAKRIKKESLIHHAFAHYCGGTGMLINNWLRIGQFDKSKVSQDWLMEIIDIIEKEIEKHEIKENIMCFRVLNYEKLLKNNKINAIKKGTVLIDEGFMSTGLVKECLMEEFPGYDTVMNIFVPKASKAVYLERISHRPNEQEILFQRGIKFKILSNKRRKNIREINARII